MLARPCRALALDTSTNTLYMSDACLDSCTTIGLARIDLATGALTFIGSHETSSNVGGLAYVAANDTLYGSDMDSHDLVTVDRTTGKLTAIGRRG